LRFQLGCTARYREFGKSIRCGIMKYSHTTQNIETPVRDTIIRALDPGALILLKPSPNSGRGI